MCRIVMFLFLGYYTIALFILAVGTFGSFGAGRDALSGIFLLPVGLPWNLVGNGVPAPVEPWLAIL